MLDADTTPDGALIDAAITLIGDDPEERARLYDLVDSQSQTVQYALMRWLDVEDEGELELLNRLASDGPDWVADAARERLAEVAEVAWWQGHFDSDPLAGVAGEEAEAALPALQEFARLHEISRPLWEPGHEAKLVATIARMIPRAARAATGRLITGKTVGGEPLSDLVRATILLPEGPELLLDLRGEADHAFATALEKVVISVPPETRRAGVGVAFARLRERPVAEVIADNGWANLLADLIERAWPEEDDPKPLMDYLIELGERVEEGTYVRLGLKHARLFTPAVGELPWVRPLFEEALAAGLSGRYHVASYALEKIARGLPGEVVLELARAVLADGGARERALTWALQGVPEVERATLFHDPRIRKLLFMNSLEGRLLVLARSELRAGKLTPPEAGHLAAEVTLLWPCCLHYLPYFPGSAKEKEAQNSDDKDDQPPASFPANVPRRDRFAAEQDPAFAGPLTEEEWTEIRRLRALCTPAQLVEDWDLALHYPFGPWHPDDRRQFEAICNHINEVGIDDNDDCLAAFLARIGAIKGECSHIEMIERLELATDEYAENVQQALIKLRRKCGLPAPLATPPLSDDDDELTEEESEPEN